MAGDERNDMSGVKQSVSEFIGGLMNGTFNYYSAEHDSIDVNITGDTATMIGKSRVVAAVYGGGKGSWRLQGDFTLRKENGNWLAGYRQLEKAYKEGKAKSIGISNFEGKYIEELQTKWEIVPQFIQVEAHPYFTQKELRKTLEKHDIRLMSWYPLGHGDKSLIEESIFAELGTKYGKSPAQIILRWHTQMGFVVIPGSKNVDHIKDNLDILDFKLTDDEMSEIAKLDKDERYYHRTDEQLIQFAGWKPEFEKA